MDARITSVLTNDPGMGIIRHADAGYEDAINNAKSMNVDIPMLK
jgi:urocanate hydratase